MSQIKGIVLCEGEDIILLGDYLSRTKKLFKKDIDRNPFEKLEQNEQINWY